MVRQRVNSTVSSPKLRFIRIETVMQLVPRHLATWQLFYAHLQLTMLVPAAWLSRP